MFVGRRMFDNMKTKALHIKSLFLQYGELQNIHWLINLYVTMCDNEGIGNINQFLIAVFFFVCFFFTLALKICRGAANLFQISCTSLLRTARDNIMFNILNLFNWNIVGHIRYVTQKENFRRIRTSFVIAGNSFNT